MVEGTFVLVYVRDGRRNCLHYLLNEELREGSSRTE